MSYILDALRRADSERERGAVPGLHAQAIPLSAEEPPAPPGAPAGTPAGRWIALGLGAGLLIALGAWWLSASDEADFPVPAAPALPAPPPTAPPRPEPTLSIPAPAPFAAPAAPPAAPARTAARPVAPPRSVAEMGGGGEDVPGAAPSRADPTFAPSRSAAPETARAPRGTERGSSGTAFAPAPQGVPGAPATAGPGNGAGTAPGAAQAAAPRAAAPPPPVSTAAPAGTGVAALATPPGAAAASAAGGRIYAPNELPEEIRRQIPGLSIGGSVYSESAASRFLIVNGQVRHEGDQAAPEVTLEKIKLRSAVMIFRGYRFELGY